MNKVEIADLFREVVDRAELKASKEEWKVANDIMNAVRHLLVVICTIAQPVIKSTRAITRVVIGTVQSAKAKPVLGGLMLEQKSCCQSRTFTSSLPFRMS